MNENILSKTPYYEVCGELYKRKNFLIQAETPWGIHEKQLYALQLLNSPKVTSLGYGGSGRSGKSWLGTDWLTISSIAYPGTGWGLARKELKNLKRTTLMTLFKVFVKYRLRLNIDVTYNQQDQIITFYNGSQIFLIDTAKQYSDPFYTRFGGYELTGALVDESNESPYEAIEFLNTRLGFRKNVEYNLPPRMLETFNPDKGHVYNRFYLPYKGGMESDQRKFIKALPSDNPDPAVKIWIEEQMKTASETTIERLVRGNFDYDDTKDKLIEEDAKNDYFLNEHVQAGEKKYISADIARLGRDSTTIRVWAGYKVIERIEINKSKVNETVDAIRSIASNYSVPMSRTICDEDGVGGGVVDYLNCYGFVGNSKAIGFDNYGNLRAQAAFEMANLINERKVFELCKDQALIQKIKQEMDWVREKNIDKDGKRMLISKDEIKQILRRSPDEWDSISMRAYFELGSKL